ncbi:hypothetical protein GCM10027034_42690 [Ramlibacter solisilvae]|uniref:Uncharacterized protein n=1 Tax=Ramlibacter tataouinensis TaxID=94132 RepID=A0A127JTP7_9BURK|nr:hypothetical protein [Ramlibacter tataouinensis]AMO23249.1 hypothetical protein UC35_10530 [Ramlibacter tataouinensis]
MSEDGEAEKLPALSFRYEPGGLQARFYHSTADYIELDLRMGGETTWVQAVEAGTGRSIGDEHRGAKPSVEHTVYFSSLWCAFPAFIRFLEAITIGVQECAFSWDPEGPYGRMKWYSSGGAEGSFRLQWSSGKYTIDQSTRVPTRDVVETLYTAFRAFAESDYEPFRYETLPEWDAYSLILADATLGDFARALATLSAAEATAVLMRAGQAMHDRGGDERVLPARCHSLEWFLLARHDANAGDSELPAAWDEWGEARRRHYLGSLWGRSTLGCWSGSDLRRLRSARIEEWLARKSPKRR